MKKRGNIALRVVAVLLLCAVCAGVTGLTALGAAAVTTAVTVKNSAPIAENVELTTYRNVAATGTLKAVDTDGDAVTFVLCSEPKRGSVELKENGCFVYTPNEGKSGKDCFLYAAVDEAGNRSAEAKVTIVIKKQSTAVRYSDMTGSDAHYAALRLAEEDVFTGERLGDEYFFRPAEVVSRGEFLSMCLKISGTEPLADISRTAFADDGDMPVWVKPYVSAALMSGFISGYTDENGMLVFSPSAGLRLSEAAVMLNGALGIADVSAAGAFGEGSAPAWAAQAAANLTQCRLLDAGCSFDALVTRADAAVMLSAAMDIIDSRDDGGLFSRVR